MCGARAARSGANARGEIYARMRARAHAVGACVCACVRARSYSVLCVCFCLVKEHEGGGGPVRLEDAVGPPVHRRLFIYIYII